MAWDAKCAPIGRVEAFGGVFTPRNNVVSVEYDGFAISISSSALLTGVVIAFKNC